MFAPSEPTRYTSDMSKINFCRILGLQTFHVEHFMIKKTITLLLISITLSFADIHIADDSVEDATIASVELSKIYENKYNPFNVLFLGGVGYTSTRRIEFDVLSMSAYNIGTKLFGIDRLLLDHTFLRFDRRLDRTEDGKKIYESSIGSIVASLLGLPFSIMADSIETTFGKIALGAMWLTSGNTKFILLGNNIYGISLAESHAIEWFIRTEKNNDESSYSFKEFGFIEEVGIQFGIILAQVTAGVSFEITNKQRNIGWFVKIIAIPIPMELPHWQNGGKKQH